MNIIKKWGQLLVPFWFCRQAMSLWILLITVIGLSLATVWVAVQFNNWSKVFYDALTDYFAHDDIYFLIVQYLAYTALFVIIIVSGNWFKKLLIIRSHKIINEQYVSQWLKEHNYYHIVLDNPDQRIAEDIRLLIEKSLDLLLSLLKNVTRLVSFMVILWQISGVQTLNFIGQTWVIKGYLVWTALFYACICSALVHFCGRHLHALNMDKQKINADYRAALLNIREQREQIAFLQGEKREKAYLEQLFSRVIINWRNVMREEFKLESFVTSYFRLSLILPVFATLPIYLTKQITLGQVMQARAAFGYILDAFSWFINAYKDLVSCSATVERLWQLQQACQQPSLEKQDLHALNLSDDIICQNVTIYKNSQPLLADLSLQIKSGQWCMLSGKSGIGKTTLLRTLAGLNSDYQGVINCTNQYVLFLPQKAYIPSWSLEAVMNYPRETLIERATLLHYLNIVGLAYLADKLDLITCWRERLSGGEQQRIGLLRALIMQPDLLILDEATNQLDIASTVELLQQLRALLPNTKVIAISHQQELAFLFEKQLELLAAENDK